PRPPGGDLSGRLRRRSPPLAAGPRTACQPRGLTQARSRRRRTSLVALPRLLALQHLVAEEAQLLGQVQGGPRDHFQFLPRGAGLDQRHVQGQPGAWPAARGRLEETPRQAAWPPGGVVLVEVVFPCDAEGGTRSDKLPACRSAQVRQAGSLSLRLAGP